ncbi:sigma-70 family RNA polymerase sigma factor [Niveibacterium sp. SC-1]|uniref:sigma-70 family RNA polymerase sigma factor n=1 Tax=Niveibacterium sp. SC-1 TaxID=3135646 RepID=UPI00311D43AF
MLRRQDRQSGQGEWAAAGVDAADAQLLARVAGGERPAFDALYRRYHPRLTRFLDRMTRRSGLVEEVLNDTMVVVWHQAARYNGGSKVSTWIFAIAYRKALKALRRFDEPPAQDDAIPEQVDTGPGPEQLLGRAEALAALGQALAGLSAEHRAVVELTYFHDMAYREIAEIVDCPVDTVKTRMFHARRRLKLLLSGALEDWL